MGMCNLQEQPHREDVTMIALHSLAADPPRPVISESFTVETVEVDDTLNGSITVRQVLHRDHVAHRSWMSANGLLVRGGEEQIERCDFHPMGWLIVAGGRNARNLSTWSCTNTTIDSDPQHCQWNTPFWPPLPTNASFAGQEVVDGRAAHRWDYWRGGEHFAFWASLDGKSPVASGKVATFHPGFHLWRILWRGFVSGPPPQSDFAVSPGIKCGPAPPPAPPPTPFEPATDCKPACGAGALCCQDPSAPPPGTCFNVKNCSDLPGRGDAAAAATPRAPRTLDDLHRAAGRRASDV